MTRRLFVSLPVVDLDVSAAFYRALGFGDDPRFTDGDTACMVWSDAIRVMLMTHTKWWTFTSRPFPAPDSARHLLSLQLDSREAVDAMNAAAGANGGRADVNPPEDHGFMVSRDVADPDGHLWGLVWMEPSAMPADA